MTPRAETPLTAEQLLAKFGEPLYSMTDLQRAYSEGWNAARSAPEPGEGLRTALERVLAEPTIDFRTGNARALFDKARRSATSEITISAQELRVLLPAIEFEAVTLAIRAALSSQPEPGDTGLLDRQISEFGWFLVRDCGLPADRRDLVEQRLRLFLLSDALQPEPGEAEADGLGMDVLRMAFRRERLPLPERAVSEGLDAAWAEAEVALPEGWSLWTVDNRLRRGGGWEAVAGWDGARSPVEAKVETGDGPTPAAALRALAARFASPSRAETE